jgi:hypothetical protein
LEKKNDWDDDDSEEPIQVTSYNATTTVAVKDTKNEKSIRKIESDHEISDNIEEDFDFSDGETDNSTSSSNPVEMKKSADTDIKAGITSILKTESLKATSEEVPSSRKVSFDDAGEKKNVQFQEHQSNTLIADSVVEDEKSDDEESHSSSGINSPPTSHRHRRKSVSSRNQTDIFTDSNDSMMEIELSRNVKSGEESSENLKPSSKLNESMDYNDEFEDNEDMGNEESGDGYALISAVSAPSLLVTNSKVLSRQSSSTLEDIKFTKPASTLTDKAEISTTPSIENKEVIKAPLAPLDLKLKPLEPLKAPSTLKPVLLPNVSASGLGSTLAAIQQAQALLSNTKPENTVTENTTSNHVSASEPNKVDEDSVDIEDSEEIEEDFDLEDEQSKDDSDDFFDRPITKRTEIVPKSLKVEDSILTHPIQQHKPTTTTQPIMDDSKVLKNAPKDLSPISSAKANNNAHSLLGALPSLSSSKIVPTIAQNAIIFPPPTLSKPKDMASTKLADESKLGDLEDDEFDEENASVPLSDDDDDDDKDEDLDADSKSQMMESLGLSNITKSKIPVPTPKEVISKKEAAIESTVKEIGATSSSHVNARDLLKNLSPSYMKVSEINGPLLSPTNISNNSDIPASVMKEPVVSKSAPAEDEYTDDFGAGDTNTDTSLKIDKHESEIEEDIEEEIIFSDDGLDIDGGDDDENDAF